jgi:hypothetical protein
MKLIAVGGALFFLVAQVKPGDYSEKGLCDLWAGAQCHATSCMKDAKERCAMVSRKCRRASRATVPKDHAERTAACARKLLENKCGSPEPSECQGVSGP